MSYLRGTLTITEGGSTANTPAQSLGRQRAANRQATQGGGFRSQRGEAGHSQPASPARSSGTDASPPRPVASYVARLRAQKAEIAAWVLG